MYLDGENYQYSLQWIVCQLKTQLDQIKGLQNWQDTHTAEYQALQAKVAQLDATIKKLEQLIASGDFPDSALQAWADKYLPCMIANIVKYVCFGLNQDGHFVAYIPTAWDFLEFDTVMDANSELLGHLVLRW